MTTRADLATDLATALIAHNTAAERDPFQRAISMLTDGSPDCPTDRALRVEAAILRDEGDHVGAGLLDRLAELDDEDRQAVLAILEDEF